MLVQVKHFVNILCAHKLLREMLHLFAYPCCEQLLLPMNIGLELKFTMPFK
jgi:hypothetical protein